MLTVAHGHAGSGIERYGEQLAPEIVFHEQRLKALFANHTGLLRAKGIFHTQNGWIVVQRVAADTQVSSTAYRRDNRYEVFWPQGVVSTDEWRREFAACRWEPKTTS
jgi:hypothetical protein